MKDKTIHCRDLIILVISLILIGCPAFASDNGQGIIRLLPTGPNLSPSGDKIAFDLIWEKNDKVGAEIGVLFLKNDEIRIVTKSVEGSVNEYSTWSEDSRRILFRSSKEDGVRLTSINLETLKEEVLVFLEYDENYENKTHIEIPYLYPIWFPLSGKAVFVKQIFDGDTTLCSAYVFDLKEKKDREIAKGISGSITFRCTWSVSHDGNYVFYTKKTDKYNDIWLSSSHKDHNGEQRLTKGYDVKYLRASPVKNEILFVSKGNDINLWTLHRLDITTGKDNKLLEGNNEYLSFPSWSQDGTLIVFVNDKNAINLLDVNKEKITAELEIDMEPITFPLLLGNKRIVFYHNYSSLWSVDTAGKNLKKIFPITAVQ